MNEINETEVAPPTPAAAFTDDKNRTWELVLTYGLARRIRQTTLLDFVNYGDGKALLAIGEDIEKLVQVLWLFIADQAEQQSISEEQFAEGLGGDAIERAAQALEQSLINFSRPAMRPAMAAIREESHQLATKRADLVISKVQGAKFKQKLDRKLQKLSTQIDQELDKL